ncbi:MAG: helix-turn-helix transcriptional regulator [Solobacterium sp.]|jgi:putative transcriptional regulator|nr:helix-turn-helix transcriptional regulator [Solobacterium sp.]MCH4048332.1 helix-turn-helix transcriptional regulator [Solobacterium sp.]MCH4074816.1 helix-turn-helix transcriptional regulator [Solobacterium sp.]
MKSHLLLKNKVREYRTKKAISQSELAKLVGSSRNTISSIETGQFSPSAYLAALLCIALDCKFEDLFYLEVDE